LVAKQPDATAPRLLDAGELGLLPGADWLVSYDANAVFGVAETWIHPEYDGSIDSSYDVGLVRFVGASTATPLIPPLTPEDDELEAGSRVTLVGYGVTSAGENTLRMKVDKQLGQVTAEAIRYAQTDGAGTCSGDSGGPAIVMARTGQRVAATTTFGDTDCVRFGQGVRVSSVIDFLEFPIASAPAVLDCAQCRLASMAPQQRCAIAASACAAAGSPCALFRSCTSVCPSDRCRIECESANPSGAADSDVLADCECGGDCANACAVEESCQEGRVVAPAEPPPSSKENAGCSCALPRRSGTGSSLAVALLLVVVPGAAAVRTIRSSAPRIRT
jgi:hypothetical protein